MSIATKSRGADREGGQPRQTCCEPSKHTQPARFPQKQGPRTATGSLVSQPRGARSAFAGWDLGRNDHTDEVGSGRPAELVDEA